MFFPGRPLWWHALRKVGLFVTLAGAVSVAGVVQARELVPGSVDPAQLPAEARITLHRIAESGPFWHHQDGAVFGNRERTLPAMPRGFYREYTVETPGARDRGARRIVCGGARPARPQACFYSGDHYATFQQIAW